MKKLKVILSLFLLASLYGCASPAVIDNMVYTGDQKTYPEQLEQNIEVAATTGGKKTNPMWTSEIDNESLQAALEQSLDQQGLLSDSGEYKLEVTLIEADQPLFGLNFTVTTIIRYVITEASSGSVIYEESITAPFTASPGDAFMAVKRLRLANEGSVKTNIDMFLTALSEMDSTVRLSMLQAR